MADKTTDQQPQQLQQPTWSDTIYPKIDEAEFQRIQQNATKSVQGFFFNGQWYCKLRLRSDANGFQARDMSLISRCLQLCQRSLMAYYRQIAQRGYEESDRKAAEVEGKPPTSDQPTLIVQ